MIGMKLGWTLLLILLTACFVYSGSSMVLAFVLLLILLPLVSIPVNLYLGKKLRVQVESAGILRKGDRGTIRILLRNSTMVPVLRLQCCVMAENQLNGMTKQTKLVTGVLPRGKKQLKLQAGDDYCGRLKISVTGLRLFDCFGIIGIPCNCEASGYLTVQPDTFRQTVTILPTAGMMEENDLYSPDRPGQDISETFQIREYVPGDSMRQIHWKLSGKLDRLIVRDPSLPITRSVLLFWERTGQSGNPAYTDAQAEVLVSLCRNLLEQSVRFTVGWNDVKTNRCVFRELRDMDDLVGFIPRLLCAGGTKEGTSGVSLLLSSGADIPAHIVYVAEEPQSDVLELNRSAQVTALLCGETPMEGAIRFAPETYPEQLAQIEI